MQGAIEIQDVVPETESDEELLDLIYDYGSFCFSQNGNEEYAYYLTEEIRRRGTYYDMQRIKDNARKSRVKSYASQIYIIIASDFSGSAWCQRKIFFSVLLQ